ncbi:hypothetical protein J8273_5802 [Carpediemonas membranifera]|uniref:Uncharacterized protein n=1 Tax=Carpediemonas membranifera TaxID=201153 RepID=A0A8J6B2J5_9EUKA|nr:hypothetical protein J8273_5802 [Carpediemonas membranifera]|eukprot:KAG9392869.1 hypothetical protein J8273_5802 [Carpediemonas membranifera]
MSASGNLPPKQRPQPLLTALSTLGQQMKGLEDESRVWRETAHQAEHRLTETLRTRDTPDRDATARPTPPAPIEQRSRRYSRDEDPGRRAYEESLRLENAGLRREIETIKSMVQTMVPGHKEARAPESHAPSVEVLKLQNQVREKDMQIAQLQREKEEAEAAVAKLVQLQAALVMGRGAEEPKPKTKRVRRARPSSAPRDMARVPSIGPKSRPRLPAAQTDKEARRLLSSLDGERAELEQTARGIVDEAKQRPMDFARDAMAQARLRGLLGDIERKDEQLCRLKRVVTPTRPRPR